MVQALISRGAATFLSLMQNRGAATFLSLALLKAIKMSSLIYCSRSPTLIIPAKAAIQYLILLQLLLWIPAFAGMMNPFGISNISTNSNRRKPQSSILFYYNCFSGFQLSLE